MHVCTHTCIRSYVYAHMSVFMCVCILVYVHMCVHTCLCSTSIFERYSLKVLRVYVLYIYIYTYIYILRVHIFLFHALWCLCTFTFIHICMYVCIKHVCKYLCSEGVGPFLYVCEHIHTCLVFLVSVPYVFLAIYAMYMCHCILVQCIHAYMHTCDRRVSVSLKDIKSEVLWYVNSNSHTKSLCTVTVYVPSIWSRSSHRTSART